MRSKPLRDFRNSKARRLYICKRKFSSQKSADSNVAFNRVRIRQIGRHGVFSPMGDNLLSQESGSWAGMRPLTSSNAGGQSYTRRAAVDTEIQKTLLLRRVAWAGGEPHPQSVTPVDLIR